MADVTFNIDFGNGFSVRQSNGRDGTSTSSASFHRLTPEQFDALTNAFQITQKARVLNTDGRYSAPQSFQTADIDFGGLSLTLYSPIPEHVDPSNDFIPIEV